MTPPSAEPDPLKPNLRLLVKLGSIVAHVDELLSPTGHEFDRMACASVLQDEEVRQWLAQMDKMQMLPLKR